MGQGERCWGQASQHWDGVGLRWGGGRAAPPTALCILQCVGAAAVVQSCLLRCKMGDPHCSASWLMFLMRVRGTEECLGMCGFR